MSCLLQQIKENKSKEEYKRIIELFEVISEYEKELKRETKALKRVQKTKYVKRSAVNKIIAAWIITVPMAATVSALIFFIHKGCYDFNFTNSSRV